MKLNKLSLKDKKLFENYLALGRHDLAVFSFANIYIWKPLYEINWVLLEGNLCVFFKDRMGCFMYLPALAKQRRPRVLKEAFSIMDGINENKDLSRIENIEENELEYYHALGYLCQQKFPDYLCLRNELRYLKGNKFKSQRASCNYFIKHYTFHVDTLKPKDSGECLDLFDCWKKTRQEKYSQDDYRGMLEDSQKVIRRAFQDYRALGFKGIAVRVNKKIKAFSFGYPVNRDIFCILYEVADLSLKGLAQFIFREFADKLSGYRFINIMDDSGLKNLEKTKFSYKPLRLIPSYIATRDA